MQNNLSQKGLSKQAIAINNEWTNNIYTFGNDSHLMTEDNLSNIVIKSYIGSTIQDKHESKTGRRKSKRMKDLIMRSTTKQIFISNTETKHNSRKLVVTVYVFDRKKQIISKRLNYFFKWLRSKGIINNNLRNSFWKKKHQDFQVISEYFKPKLSNSLTYKRLNSISKYIFIRSIYSSIGIKCKWVKYGSSIRLILTKKGKTIYTSNCVEIKHSKLDYTKLNRELLYILYKINNKKTNSLDINKMFIKFWKIRKDKIKHIIKKRYITIYLFNYYNNYMKLLNNKLCNYLPYIKAIISKIYNKNIAINIIYLKYLHLNIDLLLKAIAVKLNKRKSRLLKILKKSLKLVYVPKHYKNEVKVSSVKQNNLEQTKVNLDYNNLLNYYTGTHVNKIYNNKLVYHLFYSLFVSSNYINKNTVSITDKTESNEKGIFEIINNLKHKYTTGVWLNAKGRLTRRYKASRALYKSKHKGSLQNLDQFKDRKTNTRNLSLLKNTTKSNLQLGYVSSKKRIGVFGLKGWISNN